MSGGTWQYGMLDRIASACLIMFLTTVFLSFGFKLGENSKCERFLDRSRTAADTAIANGAGCYTAPKRP